LGSFILGEIAGSILHVAGNHLNDREHVAADGEEAAARPPISFNFMVEMFKTPPSPLI